MSKGGIRKSKFEIYVLSKIEQKLMQGTSNLWLMTF